MRVTEDRLLACEGTDGFSFFDFEETSVGLALVAG